MDILKHEIRKPIVSGLFYPDTAEDLKSKTEELLSPWPKGDSQVILVPHGTWENTGRALGAAFASAALSVPDRILLMAPVHREKTHQKYYLSSRKYFETPLGPVPVDTDISSTLCGQNELFVFDDSPHMEEHALELTLPFLQMLFPQVPIIPLLAGDLNSGNIKKGAVRLKKVLDTQAGRILVVISANLSRFGPSGETESESRILLDNLTMPLRESLIEMEKQGRISSCGTGLFSLLSAAGWADGKSATVLQEGRTVVNDRNVEKAVFYAGVSWK